MNSYFVSFMFQGPYGISAGNREVHLNRPVTTWHDVQGLTDLLRDEGLKNPILMSFTPLDGTTADKGTTR